MIVPIAFSLLLSSSVIKGHILILPDQKTYREVSTHTQEGCQTRFLIWGGGGSLIFLRKSLKSHQHCPLPFFFLNSCPSGGFRQHWATLLLTTQCTVFTSLYLLSQLVLAERAGRGILHLIKNFYNIQDALHAIQVTKTILKVHFCFTL